MSSAKILIVDDELIMRESLAGWLKRDGHDVQTAPSGEEALDKLKESRFNIMLVDIKMEGISGLDVLQQVKESDPDVAVVMITAYGSIPTAIEAMKNGAYDYISKPFNVDEIKSVIFAATKRTDASLKAQQAEQLFPEIIGKSKEMLKIFDMINRIAPTPANVLIYGESGTGKELVAQAIHKKSKVLGRPFVPITCSAIPEELMESELFGHVKGSFTGAISDKSGLFKEADSGTAFLDEIGELTPIIQTKLLRVLQEREIKPVGGTKHLPIDVRIIAATNRILEEEIRAGRFREDLFYRLAVVPIRVPSLRERKSDIPLLVKHFLEKYSTQLGKEIHEISSYALEVLMGYDFPGNVRELENIIERGVALETSNIILPENLSLSGPLQNKQEGAATSSAFVAAHDEAELFERGLEVVVADLEKNLISLSLIHI